jgi:hypothetical protein
MVGERGFDGMTMEAGRGSFIWRNNLQQGSRSIHRRSRNKGICECDEKLWDSNKEVSIRHERVEGV